MDMHVSVRRLRALRFAAVLSAVLALPACSDATGLNRPSGLDVVAGQSQAMLTGARSEPLRVVVTDGKDEPLAGVVVFWSVIEGDGAVTAATVFTDENGVAEVLFTAGATAGTARVRAMVVSLEPVEFTLTVGGVEE